LAKFIRCEAICEAPNFLSQSSRRTVDLFVFLRAPSNIKDVVHILQSQRFFILLNLLRKQSWQNSFALKRALFFRFKQLLLDLIES